jgi:DNA invertase Pin-like site-specific DNA recombinase
MRALPSEASARSLNCHGAKTREGERRTTEATMTTRVALYARVSTSTGQQDPEMQLRELREYAKHRGLTIIGEYIDKMTGSKESRPALNRLMADASRRKFDAVLVWKLDRFGRSLRHLVNALAELEALGLSFISLRDNLDLSTPSGRLMFQIIGAMAEFERSLIQERVKAGLRNAKAKGQRLGRPRADIDKAEVLAMRNAGASWRTIAKKLGIGLGTAHRIAQPRSKKVCGDFSNGSPEVLYA